MERTVDDCNIEINHLETGDDTVVESFSNTLFDRTNEFTRNGTTDDLVGEGKSFAAGFGGNDENSVSVLTATSGLADIFTFSASFFGNSFTISDLGSTSGGLS